jgi:cysteine-S-conjugate beta-lyase
MIFDFDNLTDRTDTFSYKWEKYDSNVLPMWVADMDFPTAPVIQEAVIKVAKTGLYGYSIGTEKVKNIIIEHLLKNHSWQIKPEYLLFMPGLVPAFYHAVRTLDKPNARIAINNPVYHHFIFAASEKEKVDMPFVWNGEDWCFDFDTFQKELEIGLDLVMLCNPHNPNGKVFSEIELFKIADLCQKFKVLLLIDEIHCDLILDKNYKHLSLAAKHKGISDQSITLLAPSKTFNLAGLGFSVAVIPNALLRAKIIKSMAGVSPMISGFSYAAAIAAYANGESWRIALLDYLRKNNDLVYHKINSLKGLEMKPLRATYLAWIKYDASIYPDLVNKLEQHGLGVQAGEGFGLNGHFRLNFATQYSRVVQGLDIIEKVISSSY